MTSGGSSVEPVLWACDDSGNARRKAACCLNVVATIKKMVDEKLLTFPDRVVSAWRDTVARPTDGTPVGALPQRKSN